MNVPVTCDSDINVNCVEVTVSYHKGRGIVASAFPGGLTSPGVTTIVITSGEYVKLEDAVRLNKKRVEFWQLAASNHIRLRRGRVWDLVQLVCTKNGLAVEGR